MCAGKPSDILQIICIPFIIIYHSPSYATWMRCSAKEKISFFCVEMNDFDLCSHLYLPLLIFPCIRAHARVSISFVEQLTKTVIRTQKWLNTEKYKKSISEPQLEFVCTIITSLSAIHSSVAQKRLSVHLHLVAGDTQDVAQRTRWMHTDESVRQSEFSQGQSKRQNNNLSSHWCRAHRNPQIYLRSFAAILYVFVHIAR